MSQLSHRETKPGIFYVSPHVLLPWPQCGSLNRTADQPLASWPDWLTQLCLSLSGSLLLSLTVNRCCITGYTSPCQVWGQPRLDTNPPAPLIRTIACLKWKSMLRFTGAWHLPTLSQAIKRDEVFITSSPLPKKTLIISCVDCESMGNKEGEWVGGKFLSVFHRTVFSDTARNHNTSSTAPHIAGECQGFRLSCTSPVSQLLGNDVIWCFKLILIGI